MRKLLCVFALLPVLAQAADQMVTCDINEFTVINGDIGEPKETRPQMATITYSARQFQVSAPTVGTLTSPLLQAEGENIRSATAEGVQYMTQNQNFYVVSKERALIFDNCR